jgi:hypothetical protein
MFAQIYVRLGLCWGECSLRANVRLGLTFPWRESSLGANIRLGLMFAQSRLFTKQVCAGRAEIHVILLGTHGGQL